MDARHYGFSTEEALADGDGPQVESTYWGYTIRDGQAPGRAGLFAAMSSRFFGAILLMAAGGLWLMPGALMGAEVLSMKLAASVMFVVFGGYLMWAGERGEQELQVDTVRGELRFGRREQTGAFHAEGALSFDDIVSVFLTRSKDRGAPTRLFLRVEDGQSALEIATGDGERLEMLRERLTNDLTRSAYDVLPVDKRLARHAILAS